MICAKRMNFITKERLDDDEDGDEEEEDF